jgi:hypothetical protein
VRREGEGEGTCSSGQGRRSPWRRRGGYRSESRPRKRWRPHGADSLSDSEKKKIRCARRGLDRDEMRPHRSGRRGGSEETDAMNWRSERERELGRRSIKRRPGGGMARG